MPLENAWQDPKTWFALAGIVVGVSGFFYGMLSNYWNRHESRLDALAKVLQPLTRAVQHLNKANKTRKKCEDLRTSFPDREQAREAKIRLDTFLTEYGESIKESEKEFRQAESEFHARSFRFPDKVSRLTKQTFDALSEFGLAVNNGYFDQADVAFAKYTDEFRAISAAGRGWRLADPLEGLRKRFKKEKGDPPKVSLYELDQKDWKKIMDLVNKRAISQAGNTFAVHPPKKLLEHPEIATSDEVIKELEDSVFYLVFQDGTAQLLTLVELMVFTSQIIFIASQMKDIRTMMQHLPSQRGEAEIKVNLKLSIDNIMRPETVKALLSKISFSRVASDDEAESGQIQPGERNPSEVEAPPPALPDDIATTKNLRISLDVELEAEEVRDLNGETAMMLSQALRGLAASVLNGNFEASGQCESFKVSGRFISGSIDQRGKNRQTIIASEQIVMTAKVEQINPDE